MKGNIVKIRALNILFILLCLISCKTLDNSGASTSKSTDEFEAIDVTNYSKCLLSRNVLPLSNFSGDSLRLWCDESYYRGFRVSGSGERLAEDIRKKLMAAGFPRKSEEILDAVSGFYIDWRFEKHPNHVTVRTFSQMFKDMTECKVYGGHLPASGEFRIYCVKPLDREFYFTEVEKDLTTKQDVVNLFKAAGFKESGRDPIEDFVDDMRFSRASEVELTP